MRKVTRDLGLDYDTVCVGHGKSGARLYLVQKIFLKNLTRKNAALSRCGAFFSGFEEQWTVF